MEKNIIGKCPVCGGNILENDKAFGCENWNNKEHPCDLTIWKNISGTEITTDDAVDILTRNQSMLKTFTKKDHSGTFNAFLVLKNTTTRKCGKMVGFEFPPRD